MIRDIPNIAIITEVRLPYGSAATNYVKLIAQALSHVGAKIHILIPWHTENIQNPLNTLPSGYIDGYSFQYTTKTPLIPKSKISRISGIFKAMWTTSIYLLKMKHRGELDVVIYYGNHAENQFIYSLLCRLLHIPFVTYLVEWFPAIPHSNPLRKIYNSLFVFLALRTSSALVVISKYLEDRVKKSSIKQKKLIPYLRVPILMDPSIWDKVKPARRLHPYILYCADLDGYYYDACFLIDSFSKSDIPETDLLFIGNASQKTFQNLINRARKNNIHLKFELITHYIPSDKLFSLYAGAEALLAPFHNDNRSIARFPSKIADYLMAARPVVSCNVGEVAEYLKDNETAFLSEPNSVSAYAHAIFRAATSENRNHVAIEGRNLAKESFDYHMHGGHLMDFIMKVLKNKCAE